MTTVFEAISAGEPHAVARLLAADPSVASSRNADGVTPLRWALYQRKVPLADMVLATDPELDVFDAASAGRVERLAAVIAADQEAVSARSGDGFTALHFAVFFDQPEAAAVLLAAGADVNAIADNAMKVQPLHSAIAARSRGGAVLLVHAGADVNASQEGGFTPLHEAAHNGDRALVELLLERGARRDARMDDGRSAADVAVEAGHESLASFLR